MPTWWQALRTDRIYHALVALETTQARTRSLHVPKSMLDDATLTLPLGNISGLTRWPHGRLHGSQPFARWLVRVDSATNTAAMPDQGR